MMMMRIDAGPPKLREVRTNKPKKGLHPKLVLIFCPKSGEDQKKRSSLRIGQWQGEKKLGQNLTRQLQLFRAP